MRVKQIKISSTLGRLRSRCVLIAAACLVIGMAVRGGAFVFAADPTTVGPALTTSPIATNLTAAPGSTVTTQMQVENNGQKATTISVKLQKFKAEGDNGEPQILPFPAEDESASWVSFSKTSFVAEPGVWNSVTMTIKLPSSAALGYYYAVIFSPASVASATAAGSYNIKGANAILILLDAHSSNEKRELRVNSFTVGRRSYQYLPATFKIDVQNTGNIFTAPEGEIFISRTKNGTPLATLPINSGLGNILPKTNRSFSVTWDDGFPSYQVVRASGQIVSGKDGKPLTRLKWELSRISKFRFGRYYARLVLVYNNGVQDIPINAIVSFWVIPWFLLLIGLVFLAIAMIGVWTISKNVLKWIKTLR